MTNSGNSTLYSDQIWLPINSEFDMTGETHIKSISYNISASVTVMSFKYFTRQQVCI